MVRLAHIQNIEARDLFVRHTKAVLQSMRSSYESWTSYSVEQLIFDALLSRAGLANVVFFFVASWELENASYEAKPSLWPVLLLTEKIFCMCNVAFTTLKHLELCDKTWKKMNFKLCVKILILRECIWSSTSAMRCCRSPLRKRRQDHSRRIFN